jgi:hypothetical protein
MIVYVIFLNIHQENGKKNINNCMRKWRHHTTSTYLVITSQDKKFHDAILLCNYNQVHINKLSYTQEKFSEMSEVCLGPNVKLPDSGYFNQSWIFSADFNKNPK